MRLFCEANSVRLLCSGLPSPTCAVNHRLMASREYHDNLGGFGRSSLGSPLEQRAVLG